MSQINCIGKLCSKCHVVKSTNEFSKNKYSKDGLQYKCKLCASNWFKDNAVRVKAKRNEWLSNNRSHVFLRHKNYCEKNKIKLKIKRIEYCKKNQDLLQEKSKLWKKKNALKVRQQKAIRRARLIKAAIGDIKQIREWEASWRDKKSVACYWCGIMKPGKKCHADHIIPLTKGGSHSVENLCVSCPTCNFRKYNLMPEEFNSTIRQPRLFI